MQRRTLVLGSTSPYRRELLQRLGLSFEVDSPDIVETRLPDEDAQALVRRLAEAKARAVGTNWADALVIGSDQVAVLGEAILGKPGDRDRAIEQLRAASGKRVRFLTGLCVLDTASGDADVEVVPFDVVFRELDGARIQSYVDRERPFHCAGSFKSEGLGIALFEALEGSDPSALIGLPLIRLTRLLEKHGLPVL